MPCRGDLDPCARGEDLSEATRRLDTLLGSLWRSCMRSRSALLSLLCARRKNLSPSRYESFLRAALMQLWLQRTRRSSPIPGPFPSPRLHPWQPGSPCRSACRRPLPAGRLLEPEQSPGSGHFHGTKQAPQAASELIWNLPAQKAELGLFTSRAGKITAHFLSPDTPDICSYPLLKGKERPVQVLMVLVLGAGGERIHWI